MSQKKYRSGYTQIGELLIQEGLITQPQLEQAYNKQKHTGERIGVILVNMGIISEQSLLKGLAKQLNIDYIPAPDLAKIDSDTAGIIPEHLARKHLAIPFKKVHDSLKVIMADPFDLLSIDDLQRITGMDIKPAISSGKDIEAAIAQIYKPKEEKRILEVLENLQSTQMEVEKKTDEEGPDLETIKEQVEDAPIVKLVDYIITNAVNKRASDIHVEPQEGNVLIRYRIDGVLYDIISPPRNLRMAITSRIKILSNLDIAERRLPQDGRFTIKYNNREIDLRVSCVPTIFGEKIVLRLLEKTVFGFQFEKLGLDTNQLEIVKHYMYQPYGMILLTGPTGSGKSTTLYAILSRIRSPEKNIITIEDPVEYQVKGINQIQANFKIGLTFANGLRSILRQDPDTIMVGEIRDQETAEISIRSALTGHLVFSTLHTNDAIGTVVRLINMGIEPFLVCNSLSLAIAQRLVRRICVECREAYTPSSTLLENFGLKPDKREEILFYRGKGCNACNYTGYLGRVGIFEVMVMTQDIRNLVLQNALPSIIKRKAQENGMTTLLESGLHKVIQGVTSIDEVMSTCIEEE
ncbi:Flp pilus assembly complex ATPase component TadA [bacterium]|nr:Flp pilus assembly complex ATPase component TadA [bacterium]